MFYFEEKLFQKQKCLQIKYYNFKIMRYFLVSLFELINKILKFTNLKFNTVSIKIQTFLNIVSCDYQFKKKSYSDKISIEIY